MSYDHKNPMKMTEEKATVNRWSSESRSQDCLDYAESQQRSTTVNINIHGGNNQILPNATHAEQHFHYHTTEATEPPSRTCIYNNVYIDAPYITKLRECYSATDLAKVVKEMVQDEEIPYLDDVLAVKAAFFTNLLPFCPNFKSGKTESNIRAQINKELAIKPSRPYGQQ